MCRDSGIRLSRYEGGAARDVEAGAIALWSWPARACLGLPHCRLIILQWVEHKSWLLPATCWASTYRHSTFAARPKWKNCPQRVNARRWKGKGSVHA